MVVGTDDCKDALSMSCAQFGAREAAYKPSKSMLRSKTLSLLDVGRSKKVLRPGREYVVVH